MFEKSNRSVLFNRPMKNSDINLMDDNQNEWDNEDSDCRRFRVNSCLNESCHEKPNVDNHFYVHY